MKPANGTVSCRILDLSRKNAKTENSMAQTKRTTKDNEGKPRAKA